MRLTLQLLGLLVLSLALADPAAAQRRGKAGPAANGDMLAQSCFACHGPNGYSVSGPMPTIGGQNATYLINTLKAYRDVTRPATIMTRLMKAYSEAEIVAMSQYIAGLPYVRAEQATESAKVDIGRKAYQRVCKDCHPNGGREASEPEYPILGGQWLSYMEVTMAEIVAGKRIVDDKFNASLGKVNKDELDAILHFFAAQR
jgi:sulfide dehydrogenase cytochrome subunit